MRMQFLPSFLHCRLAVGRAAARAGAVDAEPGQRRRPPARRRAAPSGSAAAKIPPPPALPGAASTGSPAPANHAPVDMQPTDALFDAINRGDIATARDAISRGADLHGQNILGMTPLELSIDLGRNDISFLLLSMRAADDGRSRQAPTARTTAKTVTDEAGETGAATSVGSGRRIGAGPRADGAPLQRRRWRAEPECRVPGVRVEPAVMAGNSSC